MKICNLNLWNYIKNTPPLCWEKSASENSEEINKNILCYIDMVLQVKLKHRRSKRTIEAYHTIVGNDTILERKNAVEIQFNYGERS